MGLGGAAHAGPQKTAGGICGRWHCGYYDRKLQVGRDLSCGDRDLSLELEGRRVDCGRCGQVQRERLPWLADNPFYPKRLAFLVGPRGRAATIKEMVKELHWHWGSVKELAKQYLREQLRRVGNPEPKGIGIDELSIRKGHTGRIVGSDLLRRRPIWFGGTERSAASLVLCFHELGRKQCRGIYLAVMDLWQPFRNAPMEHVPEASIRFDKFHVLAHLGDALGIAHG